MSSSSSLSSYDRDGRWDKLGGTGAGTHFTHSRTYGGSLPHPVQGVLVTSLDSGILLFQQDDARGFGLRPRYGGEKERGEDTVAVDAYQLASTLFTVYNNSLFHDSIGATNVKKGCCIKSIKKENQLIHFVSHTSSSMGESFLVTIFSSRGISPVYLKSLMENVLGAILDASISTLSSPRPSTVKQLRSTIGSFLASSGSNSSDTSNIVANINVDLNSDKNHFDEFYSADFLQAEAFSQALEDAWQPSAVAPQKPPRAESSGGGDFSTMQDIAHVKGTTSIANSASPTEAKGGDVSGNSNNSSNSRSNINSGSSGGDSIMVSPNSCCIIS